MEEDDEDNLKPVTSPIGFILKWEKRERNAKFFVVACLMGEAIMTLVGFCTSEPFLSLLFVPLLVPWIFVWLDIRRSLREMLNEIRGTR